MNGRQIAKMVLPSEAVDTAPPIRISSDQVFQAATSSGTLADTSGAFFAAGVDNIVIQTRHICIITPYVAALILGSKNRTPRGILELIGPALDFAQHGPKAEPLKLFGVGASEMCSTQDHGKVHGQFCR
jgi:hypothetical protein